MINKWKLYLSEKDTRYEAISSLIPLIVTLIILPNFLHYIENRAGVHFTDPILNLFHPVNLTWFTFIIIYAGLIIALLHLSQFPASMILAMRAYALLLIFRMIGMYLLPLNPPENIILLNDPFVQLFGSGEILTKDLFFSGHTSIIFLFFLTARTPLIRYLFLVGTILVAAAVLLQHVHYSIDVFAAPFFAFCAFKISIIIKDKLF